MLTLVALSLLLSTAQPSHADTCPQAVRGKVTLLGRSKRDALHYTQGLILKKGQLVESAGLYGKSELLAIQFKTGKEKIIHTLKPEYFAEGLTEQDGRYYQLTWKEKVIFVYDRKFNLLEAKPLFSSNGEGWGLTSDGSRLILSDGSSNLLFLRPDTLREERRVAVRNGTVPVEQLNELEYARNHVFANVYYTDVIAEIDPESGCTIRYYLMDQLLQPNERASLRDDEVLNGIAYDPVHEIFYVTGKDWPAFFQVRLEP